MHAPTRATFATVLLVTACASAFAQNNSVPAWTTVVGGQFFFPDGSIISDAEVTVGRSAHETVTGHPYVADQIEEGASLTGTTTTGQAARLYRDSAGRTRAEVKLLRWVPPDFKSSFVEIIDPVAGYRYMLDADSKIALRTTWPIPQKTAAENEERPPLPSQPATREQRKASPSSQTVPTAPPDIITTSLGAQYMEGALTEGTLTEKTYHLLREGQPETFTVRSETWVAPELKIIVLSKNTDSRYGESSMKLSGLLTSEPEPSLFQVPQDYKIVDGVTRR
jgi:hypothetical protein